METFDFISDNRLRIILERDYTELNKCYESACYKSVLILSGSLIEAVIVEFLLNQLPSGYTEKKILNLSLGDLIDLALSVKLIDDRIKSLSTVVKNYRNLIHPGREIRLKEQFDKETANVSISLVRLILKEIKSNYVEIYGYAAKDVIQKITNDTVSIGIFEELVKKLNYNERLKLFNSLVEIEMIEDVHQLDNPKQYVDILKAFINKDDLTRQILILHKKVETGERWEILRLLNLFKEDLNLLDKEKRDLIIKYAISVLVKTKRLSEIDNLRISRVFNTLPKLIETSGLINEYKEMLCSYYWGTKSYDNVQYLYYQLVIGLSKETKEEFETEFEKSKPLFQESRFENDLEDILPF